jgi:hypothetical protein
MSLTQLFCYKLIPVQYAPEATCFGLYGPLSRLVAYVGSGTCFVFGVCSWDVPVVDNAILVVM